MSESDFVPLTLLDERYARLRIVRPDAERAMQESLRHLGQLTPVVVCERGPALAVVDGFKRLTAARELDLPELRVQVVPLQESAAIAALLHFNRSRRGLLDLEQALIVRALCREVGLDQVQVAELLGHHKSWVSRRLALVEQLHPTVIDDVRAGMLSSTQARELVRLPRGNQPTVAAALQRHRLSSREAARVVTLFLRTTDAAQQTFLLERPREALVAHNLAPAVLAHDPRLGARTQALRQRLLSLVHAMSAVTLRMEESTPLEWSATERQLLLPVLERTREMAASLVDKLAQAATAMTKSDAA